MFQADQQFFKRMTGELAHLTLLTHTIDTMSLEAGQTTEDSTVLSVNDSCTEAVARWKVRFAQRGLKLQATLPKRLATTATVLPEQQQKLVLDNLLSNMHRYAPEDTDCAIQVSQGVKKSFISLTFINLAPDVTPEDLPFLFDRFYRVSASRTRLDSEHPTGLGLSIVKKICVAHGGSAQARLDGSRLEIELNLPVAAQAVGSEQSSPKSVTPQNWSF